MAGSSATRGPREGPAAGSRTLKMGARDARRVPGKSFEAECESCGARRAFEEFSRERRSVKSTQAMARGDFQFEWEYKFRCTTCGNRFDKVLDGKTSTLHKWQGSKHVEMKVQG